MYFLKLRISIGAEMTTDIDVKWKVNYNHCEKERKKYNEGENYKYIYKDFFFSFLSSFWL
jgi:hypothetical protein